MTWYVVVTRDPPTVPISRHVTIEDAGNKIHRERSFDRWTVLAQDGRGNAIARKLTHAEQLKLEQTLYPSLYE